nr:unnamed protein product [Spirometra erinaceieuropaei]
MLDAMKYLTPLPSSTQPTLSEGDFLNLTAATEQERREVVQALQKLKTLAEDCNMNTTEIAAVVQEARMDEENLAVGILFASKPLVQLIVNPMIGPLTNKIGYSIPMFIGLVIIFGSTIMFAFAESYLLLLLARSIQGVGSAFSTVSGGLTFGTFGMAVLEAMLPMWMKKNMNSNSWQQGIVFLASSLAYLLTTNVVGWLFHNVRHWLKAFLGMIVTGLCLVCDVKVTFIHDSRLATMRVSQVKWRLRLILGLLEASLMPEMGSLVDLRHVAVYGSVYGIADAAFCCAFAIGPVISGSLVQTVGFSWTLWGLAIVTVAYAPLLLVLRNPPGSKETQRIQGYAADQSRSFSRSTLLQICYRFEILMFNNKVA